MNNVLPEVVNKLVLVLALSLVDKQAAVELNTVALVTMTDKLEALTALDMMEQAEHKLLRVAEEAVVNKR